MFKLFKKLFNKTNPEPMVLTNPIKYEDEVRVTKRPPAPSPTKPKKSSTKAAAVAAAKSVADLEKMTKAEIDLYAEKEYGIKLDRRKRKSDMIADFVEQRRNRKQK